ncbi:MAG: DUF2252 family protein [Pirellulales bacterium]
MNIVKATRAYEAWLGEQVAVHTSELDYKHERMADRADPFPFFRGTYYRWAQWWSESQEDWKTGPEVLAVGDLHIENFGSWRDADARLVWGVNDFDEAESLPYTQDLVRLATSFRIARRSQQFAVSPTAACRLILDGYRRQMALGGRPFVLEERHGALRSLAMASERSPKKFWKKLTAVLDEPVARPPAEARELLVRSFPVAELTPQFRFHRRVGMGSLGKPRFLALAQWQGAWVAREVKAVAPPSSRWFQRSSARSRSQVASILAIARRCPDPYFIPGPRWNVRRLAPRCSRILLHELAQVDDVERILKSMGAELANVHCGTNSVRGAILRDLKLRKAKWLADASRAAEAAVLRDWRSWRKAYDKT